MAKKKSETRKYEKPAYNLFVRYSEHQTGGEPLSDERWSDRSDAYTDFRITGVYLTDDAPGYSRGFKVDFTPENGQVVYVVTVKYKSGDTFGNSYGNGYVLCVLLDAKEAIALKQQIKDGTYTGEDKYVWQGYFERLETVEVTMHTIGIDT